MENNNIQKIIILGFSHCGTSILKSIIGHINEVYEIFDETREITNYMIDNAIKKKCKYIVIKYPIYLDLFDTPKYADYIKIFIIRNPVYVYSSLNRRYDTINKKYNEKYFYNNKNHSFKIYENIIQKFVYYLSNKRKNIYLIKYEDMFNDNYKCLKNIFDSIGFEYDKNIFNNNNYNNKIRSDIDIRKINDIPSELNGIEHRKYRTYQINQPFVNNNYINKINLSDAQKKIICNNKFVKLLYNDRI